MAKEQVVCDTDVLIDYWDVSSTRHAETKRVLEAVIGLDNIIISAITRMELLAGARNRVEEKTLKKKLTRFATALINDNITKDALTLMEAYRLSHGMAIPDALIAATAMVLEMKLFTYNRKDYRFIERLSLFEDDV